MAAVVDGSDPLLAKTQAALLQQALDARLAAEEAVRQTTRAVVCYAVLSTRRRALRRYAGASEHQRLTASDTLLPNSCETSATS